MMWWGWMVGGAVLLGAELAVVNAQFYLVFIGGAALLVGFATALVPGFAPWAQWTAFGLLSLASMVGFRRRLYGRLHRHGPAVPAGPVGAELTLPAALAPGERCQAEHGGSFWTIENGADAPLAAGARVRIASVQGLTLIVRPDT